MKKINKPTKEVKHYTEKEWRAEGSRLYGEKRKDWKYICPSCGVVQSANTFLDNGVSKESIMEGIVGFSCIGRYTDKNIGCDWTLGGLFQIHTADIKTEEGEIIPVFEFADSK